jgi:hypothetical protein
VKTVIQLTKEEELKALPLLLRHSAGAVLADRTYVVETAAVAKLREAGIQFMQISRESNAPSVEGAASGERI